MGDLRLSSALGPAGWLRGLWPGASELGQPTKEVEGPVRELSPSISALGLCLSLFTTQAATWTRHTEGRHCRRPLPSLRPQACGKPGCPPETIQLQPVCLRGLPEEPTKA